MHFHFSSRKKKVFCGHVSAVQQFLHSKVTGNIHAYTSMFHSCYYSIIVALYYKNTYPGLQASWLLSSFSSPAVKENWSFTEIVSYKRCFSSLKAELKMGQV